MSTVITRHFERWSSNQIISELPARPDTVVFACIPGLDDGDDIDRDEVMPEASLITYRLPVTQYGLLTPNMVAFSVILDTTVGDFDYNWIGLLHAESDTLCMIAHVPLQSKIKTANGVQGNNLIRTFAMEFDGAAAAMQVTVYADVWQIDFTARLSGMDEIRRLIARDHYGKAAFLGAGWAVTCDNGIATISPGIGYLQGLRVCLTAPLTLPVQSGQTLWLDASWQGSTTGAWETVYRVFSDNSAALDDYTDAASFRHYLTPLATITNNVVEDLRPDTPDEQQKDALREHEKSRNHPDASLTEKGLAQYSSEISDREDLAATPAALKGLRDAVAKGLEVALESVQSALDAMQSEINSSQYPIGSPIPWMMDSLPEHGRYAFMTGQAFDRAANPILAKRYPSGRLPDMRGKTIKFTPEGRAVLSFEDDQVKHHAHPARCIDTDLGTRSTEAFDYGTKSSHPGGGHQHSVPISREGDGGHYDDLSPYAGMVGSTQTSRSPDVAFPVYIGPHIHTVKLGAHGHAIIVDDAGHSENTVKNIAFNCATRLG
ncbi:MAG: phage tail protein [Plesiomonas shigelloides]